MKGFLGPTTECTKHVDTCGLGTEHTENPDNGGCGDKLGNGFAKTELVRKGPRVLWIR